MTLVGHYVNGTPNPEGLIVVSIYRVDLGVLVNTSVGFMAIC
jgi:hypothetical protein